MAQQLRAGTLADLANSMSSYMERAMQNEWRQVKGYALPGGAGEQDRKILFAAVAQGLLKYLYDHQADVETSTAGGGNHKHRLSFSVGAYRAPLP